MNERTIQKLLDGDIDPALLREELLDIGRRTAWEPFLEEHHVEPEREEVVNLTVLQHLAIHICVALIAPTRSNYAKVLAFVKPFPGGWCRIVSLQDTGLRERLISFGQRRPDNPSVSMAAAASAAQPRTEAQLLASSKTGKRTILIAQEARKNTENTWGHKVSETIRSKPMCSCIYCHKEMKAITSNIVQHQRSAKCSK